MAAEVGWRGGRSALEPTIIDKEQRTEGPNSKATEGKAFIHFGDLLGGGGGAAAAGGGGGGGVGAGSWRVKEIDLDVQMPLPSGWEKRLDMKSGEVYFHNCNAPAKDAKNSKEHPVHDLNFPPPLSLPYTAFNDKKRAGAEAEANKSTSPEPCESQWLTKIMADRNAEAEAEAKAKAKTAVRGLEELNFMGGGSPNSETKGEAKMKSGDMEEGQCKLDLKLSDAARPHVDGSDWEWQWQSQSVCTLDKVKMALKRAEKEGGNKLKGVTTSSERPIEIAHIMPSNSSSGDSRKRSRSMDRSPSSSSGSSLCLSMHNQTQTQPQPQTQPRLRPSINLHCNDWEKENKAASNSLQAAGCPRCLLYVLLPKTNPKCPRCGFLISTDFLSSSSSSSCSSAAAACKKPRLNGLGFDISVESNSFAIGRDASQVTGSNGTRPSLLFDLNTVSLSD